MEAVRMYDVREWRHTFRLDANKGFLMINWNEFVNREQMRL